MATLISAEKAKNFGVKVSKNNVERTDYIVKCVFTNNNNKWQETGAGALFGMNLTLSCSSIDEGEKLINEFKEDKASHANVHCYEFTIAKLLENSDFAGITSLWMSDTRNDVQVRRIASFDSENNVFERERARILHRLKNKTFRVNS